MFRGSMILSLVLHLIIVAVMLALTYYRPPLRAREPRRTVQVQAVSQAKPLSRPTPPRQTPAPPREQLEPQSTPAPEPPKPKETPKPNPPAPKPEPKVTEAKKTIPKPQSTPRPKQAQKATPIPAPPKPKEQPKPAPTPKEQPKPRPEPEWTPPPGAVGTNKIVRKVTPEPPRQVASASRPSSPPSQADQAVQMDMSLLPEWYVAQARDKIDRAFDPPGYLKGSVTCELRFTILRDGSVTGISLVRSSGDGARDQLAVQALREASPLPPLPQGLREPSIVSQITFDFGR